MSLSEIRVNTTKTRTGVGTITYTETGPVITGIATASNFKTGSTNVHSTGVELTNINTGGATATFGGAISGTTASFSGTVSIGGTLTYEDVTNIDSVGLITARGGIDCNGTLEVSSTSNFDGTVKIGEKIEHLGDDDTYLGFPGANLFKVATGGSTRIYIDSDGLVWNRKDTSGVSTTTMLLNHATNASGNGVSLAFAPTQNYPSRFSSIDVVQDGNNNMDMLFKTTDATQNAHAKERLRILSNGRIAIGTNAAPRDMVHIHNSTANASSYVQFTNANTGGSGINDGTLIGISQNNSNTDGTGSGFTILNKENAEITLGTNGSEKLRISKDGAVGTNAIVRSANGGLDLCAQGATNLGTLTLGASGGQNGINRNNNTENQFRIMSPTYANPSNMFTVMYGASGSSLHEINYGGGTGWAYAANLHRFFTAANQTTGTGTERLSIISDGKIGVNGSPDANGGLFQIKNTMVYTDGTTNLLTSASKAALRVRTSSDSSKSLFIGGIDESATPYLQVGNKGTDGATATYPLVLQPYGNSVSIGGNGYVPSGNEKGLLDIYHTSDNDINNPHIRLHGPTNNDARIEFGSGTNTGEGGYISYNDADEGFYIGSRMASYSEVNLCTGMNDGSPHSNIKLSVKANGETEFKGYSTTGIQYTKWNNSYATYADDAATGDLGVNVNALVFVSARRSGGGSMHYPAAVYHVAYGGSPYLIHQSHATFANSDTDNKICLYKTANGTFKVKNRVGMQNEISIGVIHFQGV